MKEQVAKLKDWWLTVRYGKETPVYYQTARFMGFDPLKEMDTK
jgi:hypothetical protein